jgi:uncharacterized protein (TIGR03083 family)
MHVPMHVMDSDAHLAAIQRDGAAVAAAADGRLDRSVPPCPEWDIGALIHHLGVVHSWVAATVAAGGERVAFDRPERPADADLLPWFRQCHATMMAALAADPGTEVWTFSPLGNNTVGWWRRRQALETTVHRWDAEVAAGLDPRAVDADLAADGMEELLTEFLPLWKDSDQAKAMSGTLHLHSTDAECEWTVDMDASPPTARREHAKGDAAIRGPASSLYLWLWNRVGADNPDLQVFGSPAIVEAWQAIKI